MLVTWGKHLKKGNYHPTFVENNYPHFHKSITDSTETVESQAVSSDDIWSVGM